MKGGLVYIFSAHIREVRIFVVFIGNECLIVPDIELFSKVDKELEAIPKELRIEIRDVHFVAISSEPRKEGEPLKGTLRGYWKRSLRWRGVEIAFPMR